MPTDTELTQRLSEAGLPPFDSGAVYRTLRQLEATGLVSSFWDTSESGPARRMYSLTEAGELFLASWLKVMETYQAVLDQTLGLAARGWGLPKDETSGR
jgi:PadR family transcriptional regulator, regulatory protein PadR